MRTLALAQTDVPSVSDLLTGWRLVTSIAGILLIAAVVGRLLGTRRSLGAVLVSGLGGWVAGASLAVVLARNHEHGQAGFVRNLWLFSAFFTMSATVWIEMLAKPGALARAQHRLTRLPRPMRALRRTSRSLARYAQITRLVAHYGLGTPEGVDEKEGVEATGRAPAPVRVRRALEDAGGMFVKLGQLLSTRADLIPPDFVEELARLQDDVAPARRDLVQPAVEQALGAPVVEVFEDFDWEPVAAASIGQVYRARLRSGPSVIVKVQRPGIAQSVERDLDVLGQLASSAEARMSWAAEYHVSDFVAEFGDRLREELDFQIEARNATQIAGQLESVTQVCIPRIYQEYTTSSVLVMELLDGVSVRDNRRNPISGCDHLNLAETLLRCLLQQIFVQGHFHSDPHPGNVLVLEDGRIGLIDFGATGRIDPIQQNALRQMLLAVVQRDPSILRQALSRWRRCTAASTTTRSNEPSPASWPATSALDRCRLPRCSTISSR